MASDPFLPVVVEESEKDSSCTLFTLDNAENRVICCDDKDHASFIEQQERHTCTWEIAYESLSTRIYHLHEANNYSNDMDSSDLTDDFRNPRLMAIKLITDPNPDPRDLFCLYNEYNILTSHLAACKSVRAALKKSKVDGCHALYLEWAHGVTLNEWIKQQNTLGRTLSRESETREDGQPVLLGLAKLAHEITWALSDIHERGVLVNNFSPENIIVGPKFNSDDLCGSDDDESGPLQCRYTVKIIDLDHASIMKSSGLLSPDPVPVPPIESSEISNDSSAHDMATVAANESRRLLNDQRSREQQIASYSATDETADDLFALGRVLYQLFASEPLRISGHVYDASLDDNSSHTNSALKPLYRQAFRMAIAKLRESVPRSICDLISALMTEGGDGSFRYDFASEVCEDLQHIIDEPTIYLVHDKEQDIDTLKKISFTPDKLYGREEHIAMLLDAFQERFSAVKSNEKGNKSASSTPLSPSMILVCGYSGTGKTTLVQKVKSMFSQKTEYFISGKFDQLQRTEPYSAIIVAFTELCDLILAEDREFIEAMGARIVNAVGSEGRVLTDVIPSLQEIIGEQGEVTSVSGIEAQNRFKFVFREFACAVSTLSRPVVLFLDDLQWADQGTLDVVEALVTDSNNAASFICIGGYRDNEVGFAHPFAATMRLIESKNVAVTRIEVGELSEETINEVISDCLQMPPHLTHSLTEVVFRKTHGNIFFVIQLLRSLRNRGLLYVDSDFLAWRWDKDKIQAEKASDNVVELMADKIQMLNSDIGNILKLAACIGFHFDADVINALLEVHTANKMSTLRNKRHSDILDKIDDGCNIHDLFHHAVAEGLIDKVHSMGSRYNFSHDKIHQAAYSLVPEDERRFLHLHIGENLLLSSKENELDNNLFIIVDQLNRGIQCIEGEENRLELARLNLRAGQKAISSAAFLPAAEYLDTSLSLIEAKYWNSQYELSLEVYSLMVENLYCIGIFDRLDKISNDIFTHARTLQDKMRAHTMRIQSLGTRGNIQDAIDVGFMVLSELEESFPAKISKFTVAKDLIRTKMLLRGKSDNVLYALAIMDNVIKKAAMKVLNSILFYTYVGRPAYFPLVAFRMVRLSLRYGICKESVVGFAVYGLTLCGGLGDFRGGYRFGQLAMSLLQRLDARELVAHVYTVLSAGVSHWTESFQTTLASVLQGYRVGMETGDVEYAMLGSHLYCSYSFQSGAPLTTVETLMKMYTGQMQKYNQQSALAITLPPYQCALNLMRESENPSVLTGDVMNQDELLKAAFDEQNALIPCFVYVFQLFLAYLFGQYELAVTAADNARNVVQVAPGKYEIVFHTLFDGLASIEMFRRTRKKNWKTQALKAIKDMARYARHTPDNCLHKLLLMKGELASLKNGSREAEKLFEAAIKCAREQGFVHEEALAYERAGLFLFRSEDKERASQYLTHAVRCYMNWGAKVKADQLSFQYSVYRTPF